jgi:S1-C subfamily serine protease
VSGVAPGSFWDELGIDDGDVILELNGELINTPAASVELMNQFSRGYVLNLRLRTAEGNERFIDYRTPSEP